MPKWCCVCNSYQMKGNPRSFHNFPKTLLARKKWFSILGINNPSELSVYSYVCSNHFEDTFFRYSPSGKRFLKEDAVPNVSGSEIISKNGTGSSSLSSDVFHGSSNVHENPESLRSSVKVDSDTDTSSETAAVMSSGKSAQEELVERTTKSSSTETGWKTEDINQPSSSSTIPNKGLWQIKDMNDLIGDKCEFTKCGLTRSIVPNLHLYRFPNDDERAQKWILNSENPSLALLPPEILRKKTVCERHFYHYDFTPKGRIHKNAIPQALDDFETIILDYEDSSRDEQTENKNFFTPSTAKDMPDVDNNSTINNSHIFGDESLEITMPISPYSRNQFIARRTKSCKTCLDDCRGCFYKVVSTMQDLEITYRNLIIQLVPEMAILLNDSDVICYGCANILNLCGLFIRKCSHVQVELKEQNEYLTNIEFINSTSDVPDENTEINSESELSVDTKVNDSLHINSHENTEINSESELSVDTKVNDSLKTEFPSESEDNKNENIIQYPDKNSSYVKWFQKINISSSLPDIAVCHNRIISVKQPNTTMFDNFKDSLASSGIEIFDYSRNSNENQQNKRVILLGNKFDNFIKCTECHQTLKNSWSAYKHCQGHKRKREQKEKRRRITLQRMEKRKLAELKPKAKTRFRCLTCLECFASREDLFEHEELHAPWECEICGKIFDQRQMLKRHSRVHNPANRYICEFCGLGFKEIGHLKQHSRTHGEKTFFCSKCPKVFNCNASLRRHFQLHESRKIMECNECGLKCKSSAALYTHRRLIHLKNGKKKCAICGEAFVREDYLRRHIKRHTKLDSDRIRISPGPYRCKICSKVFEKVINLKSHLVVHRSLKPHKCEYCGLTFKLKQNKNRHKKKHENNPTTFEKKCPVCWKLCNSKEELLKHTSTHPTPYKCDSCDLSFGRKYLLSHHISEAHVDPSEEYKHYRSLLRDSLVKIES